MIRAFLHWFLDYLFLSNICLAEIMYWLYLYYFVEQNSSTRRCYSLKTKNFVKKNVYDYFITSRFGNWKSSRCSGIYRQYPLLQLGKFKLVTPSTSGRFIRRVDSLKWNIQWDKSRARCNNKTDEAAGKESIVFERTIDFKISVVSGVNVCFDFVEQVNSLKNAKVSSISMIHHNWIKFLSGDTVVSFLHYYKLYICVVLNSWHACQVSH